MRIYKIKLEIRSALITPVMGDTLFGHICWGILYHEGEKSLEEFLNSYNSENPPLVISNGFPQGMLPKPLLEPYIDEKNSDLDQINKFKKIKKIRFIPKELFYNSFEFTQEKLVNYLIGKQNVIFTHVERQHNTIDRVTNYTIEDGGGLFAVNEIWYKVRSIIDVYALSNESIDRVKQLFEWGLENGYGADKSTGKGHLIVSDIKECEFPKEGNRAMSLGNFVRLKNDELFNKGNLRADVMTKYGKLGGNYVLTKNPFKKPIVMFKEGATFSMKENKAYVGDLLKNVHNDENIRHHAYAPVILFNEMEA